MSRLHNKYIVTHADDSPIDPRAQYFVLRIDTDNAARVALGAYIQEIEFTDEELAEDLWRWLETTPLCAKC
jgi:hypothetical protein